MTINQLTLSLLSIDLAKLSICSVSIYSISHTYIYIYIYICFLFFKYCHLDTFLVLLTCYCVLEHREILESRKRPNGCFSSAIVW